MTQKIHHNTNFSLEFFDKKVVDRVVNSEYFLTPCSFLALNGIFVPRNTARAVRGSISGSPDIAGIIQEGLAATLSLTVDDKVLLLCSSVRESSILSFARESFRMELCCQYPRQGLKSGQWLSHEFSSLHLGEP